MPTTPDSSHSGTKQSLLIVTLVTYYTRRVKEAINIRLHPNNINRESGIDIPEAWMPTIKKHNKRRAIQQWTTKGANHWVNSKDRNAPIRAVEKKNANHSRASCPISSHMTSQPHRLKKTSSMQSKCCNLHHTWLHRETASNLAFSKKLLFIFLCALWSYTISVNWILNI